MSIKNIILVYVFLVLYGVNGAKRISELQCDETSLLHVDQRSEHPYMMDIVIRNRNDAICSATLISKNFILSSANCERVIRGQTSRFSVRKSKVIGDQYSDSQRYTINSTVLHYRNEIALIKLNEAVRSDFSISIFQPACLWTNKTLPSTNTYSIYQFKLMHYEKVRNYSLEIKSGNVFENVACMEIFEKMNGDLDMCLNLTTGVNSRDFDSPIVINIRNRNYIVGIVNRVFNINNSTILLGNPVSSYIYWIEKYVWSNPMDLVTDIGCGERKIPHRPLTSFGLPTYQGEFPWHVVIFRLERGLQDSHRYICGGTIIDYQTILTAGHCAIDERGVLSPSQLIIMAGAHNLKVTSTDSRIYSVGKITLHEEFNRDLMEYDIALLKLNGPMEFSNYIQPICVSSNLDFATNTTTIATLPGWAKKSSDTASNELLKTKFLLVNNTFCRNSDRNFFGYYLSDVNFCGGLQQNDTFECVGSSGGGLLIQYQSRWYIRGIMSMGAFLEGTMDCDLNHQFLFTDVPILYNWILNNLQHK